MFNRKYLPITIIALFAVVLFIGTNMQQTPLISQKAFLKLTRQPNENIVVLDVRTKEEFDEGHIKNAINIDYEVIEKKLPLLAQYKDKTIIVYCRSGRRAGIAEKVLINNGFADVQHLTGDMLGWKKAKLPLESVKIKDKSKHVNQQKKGS